MWPSYALRVQKGYLTSNPELLQVIKVIVICWLDTTMEYRSEFTKKLGAHCVDELKDAVDRAQLTKKNCLELALFSEIIKGVSTEMISLASAHYINILKSS